MEFEGYVLASKHLVKYRSCVGYMYREAPEGKDSGWRFFTGMETDEYLANADNIGIYDLKTILEIDASVKPYLIAEPGTSFVRVTGTNKFEAETRPDMESVHAFGYVFATKMLMDKKGPVMYMYRDKPEQNESGWCFFCGLEDQAYVDDPDNIGIYDINSILAFDESIRPYLDAEPYTAFERQDPTAPFTKIEDFSFEPEGE